MKWNRENIKIIMVTMIISIILAATCELFDYMNPKISDKGVLQRNDYGKGDLNVRLRAYFDDENYRDVTANVEERRYSAEQVEEMATKVSEILPNAILGDNSSLNEVRSNLILMNQIEGYPFAIAWKLNHYSVLDGKGKIKNEKTTNEGTPVELRAILTYGEYVIERKIEVTIFKPIITKEDRITAEINTKLEESNMETIEDSVMLLPDSIDNVSVKWKEIRPLKSLYILVMGVIVAIGLCINQREKQNTMLKEKKEEMLMDYAGIVSKFAMLLSAGMTSRNAWQRITLDYQSSREAGNRKRYAYEEMLTTYYEMQSGTSELRAYEGFGRRVGIPRYQIFISIMQQSIKKGSQGVLLLLAREVTDAFEERKSIARRMGEEAGTKLLFPMFVMLIIVMIMIVLPAFLSLQVVS